MPAGSGILQSQRQRPDCHRPTASNVGGCPVRETSRRPAGRTALLVTATFISATRPVVAASYSLSGGQLSASLYGRVRGLLRHGNFHPVGRDQSLSSAAISFWVSGTGAYNLSGNGLYGRERDVGYYGTGTFSSPAGPTRSPEPLDRQRRHVSACGGHIAGQWQSREPGHLRRQQYARIAQRQLPLGSIQRHLAEPGGHLGEHRHKFALDRSPGFDPSTRASPSTAAWV